MIKPDELVFMRLILEAHTTNQSAPKFDLFSEGFTIPISITPRDVISGEGFPLNPKRALFLLGKWADQGIYEYGVCLDLGWLTPEGVEKMGMILGKVGAA